MSKLSWIDIWKKIIKASQIALRDKDEGKFKKLEAEFPEDAMLHLEKAIFWEIQKKYDEAEKEYEKAYDIDKVPEWKRVANFFLKRCKRKKLGLTSLPYDPNDIEYKPKKNIPENYEYEVQWTCFYNLHTYFLSNNEKWSNNVRCLSISVIDRIDSLPEIAAIVFRLCMEKTLKKIFPNEFKGTDDLMRDKDLKAATDKLSKEGKIKEEEKKACDYIRKEGNKAVHEDDYKPDIIKLAITYDKLMCFLNNLCKERVSVSFKQTVNPISDSV